MTDTAPQSPEPNLPAAPAAAPEEAALLGELTAIDPHLAGLLRSGLQLLPRLDEPGNIFLVAHVGREVLLGVTRRLAALSPALPQDLDQVFEAEAEYVEAAALNAPADPNLHDDTEDNPARRAKHRRTLGEALQVDPSHPLVTRWLRVYRELVASAHYNTSPRSPAAVERAFGQAVNLLYAMCAPYFETQEVLDTLLAKEAPSPGDLEKLHVVMPRAAHRAYFFERLTSPKWLQPLAKAGFLQPPGAIREFRSSGQRGWLPWPEGGYLIRMAATQPKAVQEALCRLVHMIRATGQHGHVVRARALANPGIRRSDDVGRRCQSAHASSAHD